MNQPIKKIKFVCNMAQCPYCDCPECKQVAEPDETGQAEFNCPNCGEYFVESIDTIEATIRPAGDIVGRQAE